MSHEMGPSLSLLGLSGFPLGAICTYLGLFWVEPRTSQGVHRLPQPRTHKDVRIQQAKHATFASESIMKVESK
jgi:hypothetical protein